MYILNVCDIVWPTQPSKQYVHSEYIENHVSNPKRIVFNLQNNMYEGMKDSNMNAVSYFLDYFFIQLDIF